MGSLAYFHTVLFKELLKFGLPIVPVGLSGILLQIVDRPLLKYLLGDSAVGIYQANYRLGIFMALITGMFEYAWRPFFLSHAKDPNAKQMFSRVMTYYLLVCAVVFLVLSFFLGDIIQHKYFGRYILPPPYWAGLEIVPLVLLSYILSGIGTNLNAGIQIEKKTVYLLPASLVGSISEIVLIFVFVPSMGIMGAALATAIGYFMVQATLYPIVQKFYYIKYEFARIGKLVLLTVVAFLTLKFINPSILMKCIILVAWTGSLYVTGFFTKGELQRVKSFLGKTP